MSKRVSFRSLLKFCLMADVLLLITFVVSLRSLDDLHLNTKAHILGELELSGRDRTISVDPKKFFCDKVSIVYNTQGNSTLFRVRLWKGSSLLGSTGGGHPGYFGFKDVDDDGIKEILTWGFKHRAKPYVFKISSAGLTRIAVNGKARLLFQTAKWMNNYGMLFVIINLTLLTILWRQMRRQLASLLAAAMMRSSVRKVQ